MMSEIDRQKVFWLLKKYSSYTAWKALGDAYAAFSDAFYKAVELSDARDPDLVQWNMDWARQVLNGKIAFEKGLPLLKQGDRQVFRHNSRGQLNKVVSALRFIKKIMDPDEFVFDWMKNKDDVFRKFSGLRKATMRLPSVCETDDEISVYPGRYMALESYRVEPYNFPKVLASVPASSDHVCQTGDEISIYGIYEPEWSTADMSGSGWLDKLKSTAFSDKPQSVERGCMHYLLSGTAAPLYQEGELDKPMPVVWRLIWKDERYLDGTIPDEEADYLKPIEDVGSQQMRCEARQPCPKNGYWWTPAKENSRAHFKQGDIMPDFPGSSYGVTIWQWDVNQ